MSTTEEWLESRRLAVMSSKTYWLSYGGGVNSTALTVLLVQGRLPQYVPWRIIFADTKTEKDQTYAYIREHFVPWLAKYGKTLEIVQPKEGVLERWERLNVTGSRILRTCTEQAKIKPIIAYIEANGGGEQLLGIDAGEAHRMANVPGKHRPLVDLDIDRDECERIIKSAGLPVPDKSGCWCCPFMRVGEIIELVKTNPCRTERIERLELNATAVHGPMHDGRQRCQFGDHPIAWWRERAKQGDLFIADADRGKPCECYDG